MTSSGTADERLVSSFNGRRTDADPHLASADSEATHDRFTYWAPGLRWSDVLECCLTWPNGGLDATLGPIA